MDSKTAFSSVGAEIVENLGRARELGESIVGLRHSIIEMDQRRAKLREAGHALRRNEVLNPEKKTFTLVCEDLMVMYPNKKIQKTLIGDTKTLDGVIEDSRKEIKGKMEELMRLEGNENIKALGFDLKALEREGHGSF